MGLWKFCRKEKQEEEEEEEEEYIEWFKVKHRVTANEKGPKLNFKGQKECTLPYDFWIDYPKNDEPRVQAVN